MTDPLYNLVPGQLTRGTRAHHLLIPPRKFLEWLYESVEHTTLGFVAVPHSLLAMSLNRYPEGWPPTWLGICGKQTHIPYQKVDLFCVLPAGHESLCPWVTWCNSRIEGTIQVLPDLNKHLKPWEERIKHTRA